MTGTPTPQPAMPPMPFGAHQGSGRGVKAARRGGAFVRMLFLIGFSGFLVATVAATVFAGLLIAVNGRLP